MVTLAAPGAALLLLELGLRAASDDTGPVGSMGQALLAAPLAGTLAPLASR